MRGWGKLPVGFRDWACWRAPVPGRGRPEWQLKADREAARYFEGSDCVLCRDPVWEVAKKNMR